MHPAAVALIVLVAAVEVAAQFPRDRLYHGPLYLTRPATVVKPERTMPLEFDNGSFSLGGGRATLSTGVRSRTVFPVPVSGITLRVAFGPTDAGMITFRMRPRPPEGPDAPPVRLPPNGHLSGLSFQLAPEDPPPGPLALTPRMQIVFTLEKIDGNEGPPVFDNPDATELLWEALGRPSFSSH